MPTKHEIALRLAEAHSNLAPGIVKVFSIHEAPEQEQLDSTPIKLVEINTNTSPSGISPIQFGPNPLFDVPYPSVIVEITPSEFELLHLNELRLPSGWVIDEQLYGTSA
jgi:hypothetical protein